MQKRSVIRVLAVVLCAAMMLAVMPALSLSAELPLMQVFSYYQSPTGGLTPYDIQTTGSLDFSPSVEDSEVELYCLKPAVDEPTLQYEDWTVMDLDEPFVAGERYAYYFGVQLHSASYVFDEHTSIVSRGALAVIDEQTEDFLSFWVEFEPVAGFPEGSYCVAVGDVVVTPDNADNILGDGTARYLPEQNRLVLTDCTVDSLFTLDNRTVAGIYSLSDLTVELHGDNTVDLSSADASLSSHLGIGSAGSLTLVGAGDLLVRSGDAASFSCGVYALKDLSLQVGGGWFFSAGDTDDGMSYGIHCGTAIIEEAAGYDAQLTLSGYSSSIDAGVCHLYDFTVSAGKTLSDAATEIGRDTYAAHCDEYAFANLMGDPDTSYVLYVEDTAVTPGNQDDVFGDGTVAYDPMTHTLTLNEASLDTMGSLTSPAFGLCGFTVYAAQPLTVELIGNNTFAHTFGPDLGTLDAAFFVYGDSPRLDVVGDGSLSASAVALDEFDPTFGLYAAGNLTVALTGGLSLTAPSDVALAAVCADGGNLRLAVGGELNIFNGSSSGGSHANALYAARDIDLITHGNALIQTGQRAAENIVICAGDSVRILNTGSLTVLSGDVTDEGDTVGIDAQNTLSIRNTGTLSVRTGDALVGEFSGCYALRCPGPISIVNDSTLEITTGRAVRDSDAIETLDAIVRLSGCGTTTVITGDAVYTSAIYYSGAVVIEDSGSYIFTVGNADSWGGAICGESVRIEDDVNVTVNTGSSGGDMIGINAPEDGVVISTSGNVYISIQGAGLTDGNAVAIYASHAPISLMGSGSVSAVAGSGYKSYGAVCTYLLISAPGDLSFIGSEATAESYGVKSVADTPLIWVNGTAANNNVYFEGATGAATVLPTYNADDYTVLASTVLPSTLTDVTVTEDNFSSFKAFVLTGASGSGDPSDDPSLDPVPIGSTTPGDANDDNDVNMKDVLTIRKYIANLIGEGDLNLDNADFNGDGSVDMKDVLLIRKLIAGLLAKDA